MQLKQTTGYVIRMLMHLAEHKGTVRSSTEISASLKIPQKYVIKISAQLRNNGLISAHTGTQGGYSLGKPADKIRLYDIVLLMEGTVLLHSFTDMDSHTQQAFGTMQQYWENFLKSVTVQDLLNGLTVEELKARISGDDKMIKNKENTQRPQENGAEEDIFETVDALSGETFSFLKEAKGEGAQKAKSEPGTEKAPRLVNEAYAPFFKKLEITDYLTEEDYEPAQEMPAEESKPDEIPVASAEEPTTAPAQTGRPETTAPAKTRQAAGEPKKKAPARIAQTDGAQTAAPAQTAQAGRPQADEWRISEMDKLSDYISHMQFKKRRVGGVDEENVLVHIKNICDIVRETMEEQERGFETTIRKLQENQSALKAQLQKYAKTCRKMQDINNELNNRIQELQGAAEKYTAAQEIAERTQREYGSKYQELMATVNTLQGVKKEAEEKARQEMRERLRSDEEKARGDMLAQVESERRAAARQLKLLEDEIDSLSRRKNEMESSLKSEREQWMKHLDWFASRLGADGDKAPAEPRRGYYSGYEADENGV